MYNAKKQMICNRPNVGTLYKAGELVFTNSSCLLVIFFFFGNSLILLAEYIISDFLDIRIANLDTISSVLYNLSSFDPARVLISSVRVLFLYINCIIKCE